jgi:ABC-2 type transport system permease protein
MTAAPRLPTPISRPPREPPLARAVLAQTRMELTLAFRRGESLLVTALVPLLLLVFFGYLPVLPAGAGRQIDFLLPGILALAVMSASMVSMGIATAFERQYGVLKRLGGSPLPRAGLLAAKMLSVLFIQVLQIGLLTLVGAVLFGWRPGGQVLTAMAVLLLGTLTFAALGLLIAGTLRAEATLAVANALYLVFLLLGDMIFPLAQLPVWLADFAHLLPAAAFSVALRGSLEQGGSVTTTDILVLLAWGIVAAAAAARTFQWE